ncbi:MAG TPA: TfuA-related McrA-glycine thioamidation protein, partial [Candidatus Methanoperedens sp.]|nr:TfuA-related McrA-glycine thioamidation protein [Candidatus Methanoperedens sp.]
TSINHQDAEKILDADYRSPVRRDDIRKLMKSLPDIIGIIDGVFFDSAAVAHREIIEAIRNGIIIVGGASMGAIRASELDSYGMIGVGRIYEMYRNGVIDSDDEVAVTFDAETMKPLSIPLLNVRVTVKALVDLGILNNDESAGIIGITRKIFYPDRNYQNILNECMEKGVISREKKEILADSFRKYYIDAKREDAVLVLEKIKELMDA